ncbi:MAG: hypothetical protein JWO38_3852 [Gemmataceae bacterium]|nr:hypothetical protein [Gemmataceae bacterium]
MRNVGTALSNSHDFYQRFPAATYPNPNLPPERLSWLFELDLFVHAWMDPDWTAHRTEPWDADENLKLLRQPMPLYVCPAAARPTTADGFAVTSYVGVTGVGLDAATVPGGDPRAGLFGYDRVTALPDVRDGPGMMIAVVETDRDPGPWMAGGRPTARPFDPGGPRAIGQEGQFGGLHVNGVNVLFVDGSVRFLRDTVNGNTLAALFIIAGGDHPGLFGND